MRNLIAEAKHMLDYGQSCLPYPISTPGKGRLAGPRSPLGTSSESRFNCIDKYSGTEILSLVA